MDLSICLLIKVVAVILVSLGDEAQVNCQTNNTYYTSNKPKLLFIPIPLSITKATPVYVPVKRKREQPYMPPPQPEPVPQIHYYKTEHQHAPPPKPHYEPIYFPYSGGHDSGHESGHEYRHEQNHGHEQSHDYGGGAAAAAAPPSYPAPNHAPQSSPYQNQPSNNAAHSYTAQPSTSAGGDYETMRPAESYYAMNDGSGRYAYSQSYGNPVMQWSPYMNSYPQHSHANPTSSAAERRYISVPMASPQPTYSTPQYGNYASSYYPSGYYPSSYSNANTYPTASSGPSGYQAQNHYHYPEQHSYSGYPVAGPYQQPQYQQAHYTQPQYPQVAHYSQPQYAPHDYSSGSMHGTSYLTASASDLMAAVRYADPEKSEPEKEDKRRVAKTDDVQRGDGSGETGAPYERPFESSPSPTPPPNADSN